MAIFEKYQELKSNYDFVYKGIHLNKVVTIMLWSLAKHNSSLNIKSFIKLFCHLDTRELKQFSKDDWIITFGRYNRKDHIELFENVLKRLNHPIKYAKPFNWGKKYCFNPELICSSYKFVFSKKYSSIGLSEKLCLANELVFYANAIKEINRYDFNKAKKFMCLCDSQEIENLLTQFFQTRKVPTYAFMEGIMFVFKGEVPFDCIQYENLTTDTKLSWGHFSRDELIKYGIPPERIKVAGYPKYVEGRKLKPNNTFKKCMALLSRDSFRSSNMCLLDILSNYSKEQEIWLKLHPGCDKNHYEKYASDHQMHIVPTEKTVNECLNQDDFDYAISVNTSAYYEALMRGLPCFRLYDGKFNLMFGMDDTFGSVEGYNAVYEKLSKMKNDEYQVMIDKTLKYAIGFGLDNYKEIISE